MDVTERYEHQAERQAIIRRLEARGLTMKHDNHFAPVSAVGDDGEPMFIRQAGELVFSDAPDEPAPDAVDWRALAQAANTPDEKIALLLKRTGLA